MKSSVIPNKTRIHTNTDITSAKNTQCATHKYFNAELAYISVAICYSECHLWRQARSYLMLVPLIHYKCTKFCIEVLIAPKPMKIEQPKLFQKAAYQGA
jgi:hypothetical protein